MLTRFSSFRLSWLFLLHVLVAVGGCVTTPSRYHEDRSAVTLIVENKQFDDIVVYLVRGGAPIRLGVVEGFRARTFRLLPAVLGAGNDLVLRAATANSRVQIVSETFQLHGARNIGWTLYGSETLPGIMIR